jgi:hypothetical protein
MKYSKKIHADKVNDTSRNLINVDRLARLTKGGHGWLAVSVLGGIFSGESGRVLNEFPCQD